MDWALIRKYSEYRPFGDPQPVGEKILHWPDRAALYWVGSRSPHFGDMMSWLAGKRNFTVVVIGRREQRSVGSVSFDDWGTIRGFFLDDEQDRVEFCLKFG